MSDPNTAAFQPPPPPAFPTTDAPDAPVLSTGETLTGIFFEPGRVFESFRARPRFVVAMIIIIVAFLAFTIVFYRKYGYDTIIRAAIEESPQAAQMSPEQMDKALKFWNGPIGKAITFVAPVIAIPIFLGIGAALYLLLVMAMGKKVSYWQALSVWVYSSLPPIVLTKLLDLVLVFVKPVDGSELLRASRSGLVRADLGFLVNPVASPILATFLGSIDIFAVYGLFLGALGLRKVARLTNGAAWGIVLTLWFIGLLFKLGFAAIGGKAI